MITLNNINLSSIDLSGIDLRGIKLGLEGRGGGSGDGFPVLPGDITRWHFGGLTNEMMAAMDDPRIEDADHKGRFLSFKNFAWKGMSGVGGYVTNKDIYEYDLDRYSYTFIENSTKVHDFYIVFELIGYDENFKDGFNLDVRSISQGLKYRKTYTKNGIYIFQYKDEEGLDDLFAIGYNGNDGARSNFTVKILPLYPGFILGDGVDDEAATIDNLDLEDTYTVYTPLILLKYGGVVSGKRSDKDFSLNTVSSSKSIGFDSANAWSGSIPVDLFEFALVVCKRDPKTMYVKDLITGKANQSNSKEFVPNPGKYFIWRNTGGSWCQVAIAGQIICNGHFSTDEEDAKVLAWHKKQYPWLFPDQAWTVTGKTNEDEDRATIANITGNGNDLVLSNFAFSGNSGYGLYGENYNGGRWVKSTSRADITWTSYSVNVTSVKIASTQLYYQAYLEQPSFTVPSYAIKVYGLKDGQTLSYKQVTSEGQQIYEISEDGIYTLPSFLFIANGNWYGFTLNKVQESCDITIEQIPEYEGYLVTDGVDDRVVSSSFTLNKDWTIVGNWKMLQPEANKLSGIVKQNSLFIYNHVDGLNISINDAWNFFKLKDIRSVNAICSDGRIYLNDWTEIIDSKQQTVNESVGTLVIGILGNVYTSLAFKNLGFYNNQILSKDDCIKAYNYLQTLKAK